VSQVNGTYRTKVPGFGKYNIWFETICACTKGFNNNNHNHNNNNNNTSSRLTGTKLRLLIHCFMVWFVLCLFVGCLFPTQVVRLFFFCRTLPSHPSGCPSSSPTFTPLYSHTRLTPSCPLYYFFILTHILVHSHTHTRITHTCAFSLSLAHSLSLIHSHTRSFSLSRYPPPAVSPILQDQNACLGTGIRESGCLLV
jgi:hypothetical protein